MFPCQGKIAVFGVGKVCSKFVLCVPGALFLPRCGEVSHYVYWALPDRLLYVDKSMTGQITMVKQSCFTQLKLKRL